MYQDETQRLVAEAYRGLGSPDGAGTRFYTEQQVAALPPPAREWALGVGNPVSWAGLETGEIVADLGCGAGIDTLLAAAAVGPSGRVIGVDLLPEMLQRAEATIADADADNIDLQRGEIERLPLADESVDVVISNGTINLSARKSRVLAEAHRVLRPGGRLCVSDLTIREEDLPTEILMHPSAWAG
jgi:ubiquinone/menaquinone biosynthesis C-methylase UbiE